MRKILTTTFTLASSLPFLVGCGSEMGLQYSAVPGSNPPVAATAMLPGGHSMVSQLVATRCNGQPQCINDLAYVKTTTEPGGRVDNIVLPVDSVTTETWAAVAGSWVAEAGSNFLGGWAIGHFAPHPGNIAISANAPTTNTVGVATHVNNTAIASPKTTNVNVSGAVAGANSQSSSAAGAVAVQGQNQ